MIKIQCLIVVVAGLLTLRTRPSVGVYTYLRYDQTNFDEITAGSKFQVKNYSSIDASYNMEPPPGGKDSGGAFLFDNVNHSCMKTIQVRLSEKLTIHFSYWCDVKDSELYIRTQCNWDAMEKLCDRSEFPDRNGKWNQTFWMKDCIAMDKVRTCDRKEILPLLTLLTYNSPLV